MYVSGALHGDERLGPHIAYYLVELLVSNFGKDPDITDLLKRREIIVTPMTNAVGFYHNEREERLSGEARHYGYSADINRDFPYNQDSNEDCLKTIAARTVYRLFTDNLFVSAITFHGGDNSITYPWGSNNHIDKLSSEMAGAEAPDHAALKWQAEVLRSAAGPDFKTHSS